MRRQPSFTALLASQDLGKSPETLPPTRSDGDEHAFLPFLPLRSRKTTSGLRPENFGKGSGEAATPQQGPISVRQTVRFGFGAGGGERREVRQRLDLGAHTSAVLEQTVEFSDDHVGNGPPKSRPSKTPKTNATRSKGRKRQRPEVTGDSIVPPESPSTLVYISQNVCRGSHTLGGESAQASLLQATDDVDELVGILNDTSVCDLSSDGEAQFERIWLSGNLNPRNVTLRSDENKRRCRICRRR